MNKDNVRKYMADIQIAMGKILEEMDGFEAVASNLLNYDNLDEHTIKVVDNLGISKKEASTITTILSKTEVNSPEVSIVEVDHTDDDINEGLTDEQIQERDVCFEVGIPWHDPRVKQLNE